MRGALKKHVQVHHTCQHCGRVGMGGQDKKTHEEACKRKQERKRERKKRYEELKVARQKMLLICLADKEADKESDKDTNPTPIATLTDNVLSASSSTCVPSTAR
jgi:hypothetical protein